MNLDHKNKFRLIALTVVLTLIGIIISLKFLQGIVGKVKDSKIKVMETERDIALLEKIAREKQQYDNEIKKVTSTLPSEYFEVSFFTNEVERLAQENSLTLETNIDEEKSDENENFSSIQYALQAKGTYPSVSEFLTQISKLPYHTMTDDFIITYDEGELISNVVFKIYVRK